ncbi:MAG: N-acetyl-gamma-glutamyl-phosphate reductase [Clostridia bacterium]|nr:N-acetyl-gamma-glutamyl-phosphate reductase [Clostridia bacterium]
MKYKIFVDGQEGTTGLKIFDYLSEREDLEILKIDPDKRKDPEERRKYLNEADIAFLCLPNSASIESASLVTSKNTRLIDASTAFRTDDAWTYGLPELNKKQRDIIRKSKKVSNPGCYATGFIMAVNPLVQQGILPKDYPVSCAALSGYSGGGKKLIEKYGNPDPEDKSLNSPKHYALKLDHKHLPEMQKHTGLAYPPLFTPIVSSYYKGMTVSVPLVPRLLSKKVSPADVRDLLAEYYSSERFVRVLPYEADQYLENGFLNTEACNDTNMIDIFVFGHNNQILLVSRLDNLGKGASGAAIQNMNIMLGLDEGIGLKV